ncbi:MAG: MarR family transcriptional regulator [Anaerolineae bacterium]|nr:MarR family transcriptional regulator [Anaerolineae bacterium]MDW8171860.1 MarR family transcriptional regulator [Anaerolineae bacterium]
MTSSSLKDSLDHLLFDGSVWCNMDVALRNLDQVIGSHVRQYNISVIEWYILRALYQQDGVQASKLARAVGRSATSFTPNLDKLQEKGLIERRQDIADRRATLVHLTPKGHALRDAVLRSASEVDQYIARHFAPHEFQIFLSVLQRLQELPPLD